MELGPPCRRGMWSTHVCSPEGGSSKSPQPQHTLGLPPLTTESPGH